MWWCVFACALLALAFTESGCVGDDDAARARAEADTELAAAIEASAKRHERERERQRTTPPASTTDAPAVEPELPTGSKEIDGRTASRRVSRELLTEADKVSFSRLAERLPGEESVAVATLGRSGGISRTGTLRTGVAWSTAKVPVAMAAISAGVAQRQDLVQAITASDNAAAERLWAALGGGANAAAAATAQLRTAGDARTQIEAQRLRSGFTAFGQTQWALTDQARFVGGMACAQSGPEVLGLMNEVVAGQRWGLGSTGRQAQFKAGWGPGVTAGTADGWLDRQMGIVIIGGKPIAVAMATTAGDHGTATQNLTAIAQWVVTHVNAARAPRRPRC